MVEMGGTYTSRRRMRQWFTHKKGKSRDACRESRGQKIVTPTRVYYVDGFDTMTQTVYEFLGCVWHGCPCCHLNRR